MDDKNTVWFTKYGNYSSESYISKIDYYKYKLCLKLENSNTIDIILSRFDLNFLRKIISTTSNNIGSKDYDYTHNSLVLKNICIENYNKKSILLKNPKNLIIKLIAFPEEDSKGNITGRTVFKTEFFYRIKIFGKIKFIKPTEIKLNKDQVIEFNTRINSILL